MAILEVKDLCFNYEEKHILNHINLKIDEGSFVSIIGPNGSGKTTLLKAMSSILAPNKGRITLKGKEINKYKRRELARLLAFVPQNTSIDFEFTAMDVVLMGRSPYMGLFQSEKDDDMLIAENAMKLTNTYSLKDQKITEMSGGERQRVVIACALAQTPEIILLDEPISNLDIQHQVEVLGILKKLNREKGLTVVAVLHDLNLSAEYSDSIILLKDGKLVESGKPVDVITEHNIQRTYNANVYMTSNPVTGNPHVIAIPKAMI